MIKKYALIAFVVFIPALASARTIQSNEYMVWGIGNDQISIPAGSIITEAVLTIQNVTPQETPLYVHLLDNTDEGVVIGTDAGAEDVFGSCGVLLYGTYEDGNYVCRFSQNENAQSPIRVSFPSPTSVTLVDSSTVQLSSALLELMDYVGNGRGFGLGMDVGSGITFLDMSLAINVQSYQTSKPTSYIFYLRDTIQQKMDSDAIIVIEAENYNKQSIGCDYKWSQITSLAGSGSDAAIQAVLRSVDETGIDCPRVDYQVNFVKTGTYYVWVRGYKTGSADDSCNMGLDGVMLASSDRICYFNAANTWYWSNATLDYERATIEIDSLGEHTVNLWMREAGFRVDQIVITANPDYIPVSIQSEVELYQQDNGASGLVLIEAEIYHNKSAGADYDWASVTSLPDSSGAAAIQAVSGTGNITGVGFPRVDYRVNFVKTGTHYLWVRGYKTGSADDSCNMGLDGVMLASSDRICYFNAANTWYWSNATLDYERATIEIDSLGEHTINMWMREAGFRVDQIVVTTDPFYTPDLAVYQQDDTMDGLVSIEAEAYHSKSVGEEFDWTGITAISDSMGGAAIQAAFKAVDVTGTGLPQTNYRVNFVKTGMHYVWIRGYKTSSEDDSCHAGLDGVMLASSDRICYFNAANTWYWSNATLDYERATIEIDSLGEHTVNLWMREAGFRVDQIVITANPDYLPF